MLHAQRGVHRGEPADIRSCPTRLDDADGAQCGGRGARDRHRGGIVLPPPFFVACHHPSVVSLIHVRQLSVAPPLRVKQDGDGRTVFCPTAQFLPLFQGRVFHSAADGSMLSFVCLVRLLFDVSFLVRFFEKFERGICLNLEWPTLEWAGKSSSSSNSCCFSKVPILIRFSDRHLTS